MRSFQLTQMGKKSFDKDEFVPINKGGKEVSRQRRGGDFVREEIFDEGRGEDSWQRRGGDFDRDWK